MTESRTVWPHGYDLLSTGLTFWQGVVINGGATSDQEDYAESQLKGPKMAQHMGLRGGLIGMVNRNHEGAFQQLVIAARLRITASPLHWAERRQALPFLGHLKTWQPGWLEM